MSKLAPYWKALVGFITPGAVLIGSAVTDVSQGGSRITTAEWVTALVACVVTAGAVGAVPNKPAASDYQGKHEAGAVDVALVLLITILVIVTLLLFRVRF